MKGLLLKDWYLTKKYCKAYPLIFAGFILASVAANGNFFFSFYPCLFSSMIPVTLLSLDEQSGWSQYSGTLPYTKAQIVSGKYLVGLIAQTIVLALSAVAQAVRMNRDGFFDGQSYGALMALLLIMSCFSSSITLPFMFKYGVEKGRIARYIMIGIVGGGSAVAADMVEYENMEIVRFSFSGALPFLCVLSVALYALSWYLSIVFYNKREV